MLGYLQHRSLRVLPLTRLVRARIFPLAAAEWRDRENRGLGGPAVVTRSPVQGQPRTQAIRGWPGVRGWPG